MQKSISSREYKVFLQLIKSYREQMGITQAELAVRLGETQSFVSKVERGERRLDVLEFLSFCEALGVPPLEFITTLQKLIRAGY